MVLRVLMDAEEVCAVSTSRLPVQELPLVELARRDQRLHFVDSQGKARTFDLSSAFDEGARALHLSLRISAQYAVQPDGVLTERRRDNPQRAFEAGGKGLRFQPFFLPESSRDAGTFAGRGLFSRGLHYAGIVTPGNVSLMCLCDHCQASFRLQSFHAGFSNCAYFYCSGGLHTLMAGSYEPDAPSVTGKADAAAVARFERRLPRCADCGGDFKYLNPLLCPDCGKPYIDFRQFPEEREQEYYGNFLYGGSLQEYAPAAPP